MRFHQQSLKQSVLNPCNRFPSRCLLILCLAGAFWAAGALCAFGQEAEPGEQVEAPAEEAADAESDVKSDDDDADIRRQLKKLQKEMEQMKKEQAARQSLEVTEEEEREAEEAILEAAGREYYLLQKGLLEMEYKFNYAYYSYDQITLTEESGGGSRTSLEHHSNHNLSNHLVAEYALYDNFTVDADIPFVYKYDDVGESGSKDVHDLGDISLGTKYQPFKTGGGWPSPIFHIRGTLPASKGDYDINPESELSTGSGLYSASAGFSLYHPFDPASAFASLSYRYRFEDDDLSQRRGSRELVEVDPGDRVSAALGFGYALSYKVSLSMSLSYTYGFNTDYKWADGTSSESGDIVYASLNLSTNWRLSPKQSVIVGAGVGLTDDDPDFTFSLRVPLQFDLS